MAILIAILVGLAGFSLSVASQISSGVIGFFSLALFFIILLVTVNVVRIETLNNKIKNGLSDWRVECKRGRVELQQTNIRTTNLYWYAVGDTEFIILDDFTRVEIHQEFLQQNISPQTGGSAEIYHIYYLPASKAIVFFEQAQK